MQTAEPNIELYTYFFISLTEIPADLQYVISLGKDKSLPFVVPNTYFAHYLGVISEPGLYINAAEGPDEDMRPFLEKQGLTLEAVRPALRASSVQEYNQYIRALVTEPRLSEYLLPEESVSTETPSTPVQ